MINQIEFVGKSGAVYRYTALEEDRFLPPAGANFIIAKPTPEGPGIVFAGETDNLAARTWRQQLDQARGKYGADTTILTRLNVKAAIRKAEQDDIIEEHQPEMNKTARA